MHAAIATLTAAALALSIAAAAPAQNLLLNGDFDDDILDWNNLDGTKQWNSFDPFSDPDSGSMRIQNLTSGGTTAFVDQCVAIEEDTSYGFEVWWYAFEFEEGNGRADVRVFWFNGSACSGDLLAFDVYQSTVKGEWERASDVVTAPANAVSASVRLGARKFGEGPKPELLVYFDAVYLPEPGAAAGLVAIAALASLQRRRGALAAPERS